MNTRLQQIKGRYTTPGQFIRSRMYAGDPSANREMFPFLAILNGSVVNGPVSETAQFVGADLAASIEYSRLQTPFTPVSKTLRNPAGTTSLTIEIAMADVVAQDPDATKIYYPYVDLRVTLPPLLSGPASNLQITIASMPSENMGRAWPLSPVVTINQEDVAKAIEMQFMPFVMRRSIPRLVYGALSGTGKIAMTVEGLPDGSSVTMAIPGVDHYTLTQTLASIAAK